MVWDSWGIRSVPVDLSYNSQKSLWSFGFCLDGVPFTTVRPPWFSPLVILDHFGPGSSSAYVHPLQSLKLAGSWVVLAKALRAHPWARAEEPWLVQLSDPAQTWRWSSGSFVGMRRPPLRYFFKKFLDVDLQPHLCLQLILTQCRNCWRSTCL